MQSVQLTIANYFYPRSPCGERPLSGATNRKSVQFLSTLSLRRATVFAVHVQATVQFLSTLSLRRATFLVFVIFLSSTDFYPRSPCGERHIGNPPFSALYTISIHALLAESDDTDSGYFVGYNEFLSTLSLRRATAQRREYFRNSANFYPRSPCGERPKIDYKGDTHKIFLSTLSLRRATNSAYGALEGASISIHALLAESDRSERPETHQRGAISIHALLAESDLRRHQARNRQHISIHALLAESDRSKKNDHLLPTRNFYPRSPCGERLTLI